MLASDFYVVSNSSILQQSFYMVKTPVCVCV